MEFPRATKASVLTTSRNLGLFRLAARSEMRCNSLFILSYHGISAGKEHDYDPGMFMRTGTFERRMQILKDCRASVLGLDEALRLLSQSRLPPLSVVITFDDGWADFYTDALPVLRRYGFPATVYLTTYYCLYNKPIFRFAVGYTLWQRRTEIVENPRFPFLPRQLDLQSPSNRAAIVWQLDRYAKGQSLSGAAKNDLTAELSDMLGLDYESLSSQSLFHLMTPAEVAEIARDGVDLQLHTHRHRTPLERQLFLAEINDNQRHLQELTGQRDHVHFCYPSGAIRPDFITWLRDAGVQSATTCLPGYSAKTQEPLSLPRLLDHEKVFDAEFEAWVTGFAAFTPHSKQTAPDVAPE